MKRKVLILIIMSVAILFINNQNTKVFASSERILEYGTDEYVKYYKTGEYVTIPSSFKFKEREFRGTWVSNFAGNVKNYTTEDSFKKEMTEVLDILEYYNYNAIIFHIRTHNNALYNSELNPLASFWEKVDFNSFDPLEWLIDETHKRGMEFHAWMNPYRVQKGEKTYKASSYPLKNPANNEENIIEGVSGGTVIKILDPGKEEVKKFLVDTCMEVVRKYNVDAIHFDDYFYVEDAKDEKTFQENNPFNLSLDEWRRNNINDFIERLSKEIKRFNKENNRYVQFGIAPSGVYKDGDGKVTYDDSGSAISSGSLTRVGGHYGKYLYCDTKKWVDNEWIDYIMPQCYHDFKKTVSAFASKVDWWNDVVRYKNVNLYIGIGFYGPSGTWDDPNELKNQIYYLNKLDNVKGFAIYSYATLKSAYKNTIPLKNKQIEPVYNLSWNKKCYPVSIKGLSLDKNCKIENLSIKKIDLGYEISFNEDLNTRFYALYRASKESLDKNDLIKFTSGIRKNGIVKIIDEINDDKEYVYTLLPLNYNNETGASKSIKTVNNSYEITFVTDDGKVLSQSKVTNKVLAEINIDIPNGYSVEYSKNLEEINSDEVVVVKFYKNITYEYLDTNLDIKKETKKYYYQEEINDIAIPILKEYNFLGFIDIDDNYKKASYEVKKYKVVFVDVLGNEISREYLEYLDDIVYPKINDENFKEWSYSGKVLEDIVIHPIYNEPRKIHIKFVNNLEEEIAEFEVDEGTVFKMIEVEKKDGYQFKGFFIDGKEYLAKEIVAERDMVIVIKMEKVSGCNKFTLVPFLSIGLIFIRKKRY